MYVVVVGMGEVGRQVLRELERGSHDVVAVDSDPRRLEEVEETYDVGTLVGYGASLSVLRKAGCDRADLLVAVTDRDEVNLVAALTGRQLGARQTIARVQSPEFSESDEGVRYGFLGIDAVVNPRILVAQEIAKIARSHGALDVMGLAGNRVEIVQLVLPASSKMIHKPLADLSNLPRSVLVAAVVTEGELRIPGGADVLLPDDRIYLVGPAGEMEAAEELFTGGREARRVCIVGGGVVGTSLARGLADSDVEIMLIERSQSRAYELAVDQPKVKVIQGDGTDLALLEEEQTGSYDLFAAVTDDDEINLMAGLLAKRLGVERVISLVHRPDYMDIYRQLGIDVVLSPRITASEQILRFVQKVALKSLHILERGQAVALELVAVEGSRIVNTPISRLNLPRGAIIATIVHNDQVTVPRGADRIVTGDTVVVLTTAATRPAIERLFKTRALSMRTRARLTIPLEPLAASVAWPVGLLLGGTAIIMLLTALVGLLSGSPDGAWQMSASAGITGILSVGLLLMGRDRERRAVGRREALLIVSASWVTLSLVGGLPFLIGADFTVADAIFESTSGFTTTGATILPEIRERLNPALHFWRMLSHWLGGMGIVVLFVAVFPALGVGGKHLYRSEVPGPRTKDLTPRIRQTSARLWWTYLLLTATTAALLWAVGLPPFEAVVQSFSAIATGGFSTLSGSIGGLEVELQMSTTRAILTEWILIAAMFLGSLNFGLYHAAFKRGPKVFWRHYETRVFTALLLGTTVIIGVDLIPERMHEGMTPLHAVHDAFRDALFQLVSVASTTGFGTDDYEVWPTFAKMILLGFFFTGGCSGSTSGGMKLIRWIILVKATLAELQRSFRHLVVPVRVGRQIITSQHMVEVMAFTAMFMVTVGGGAVSVALIQGLANNPIDGTTAVMASLACVANVGPGMGMVGPTDNFGFLAGGSKLVLSACMLLGRLEFLTVLALFTPSFWRR